MEEVKTPLRILGKNDILDIDDTIITEVAVPEWGGSVLVKGLSAVERDAFEASMISGSGKNQKVNTQNIRAKLCSLAIVDEKGDRIFDDLKAIEALGKKSAAALTRVYEVAAKQSGLRDEDVDEMVKNSGNDQLAV